MANIALFEGQIKLHKNLLYLTSDPITTLICPANLIILYIKTAFNKQNNFTEALILIISVLCRSSLMLLAIVLLWNRGLRPKKHLLAEVILRFISSVDSLPELT